MTLQKLFKSNTVGGARLLRLVLEQHEFFGITQERLVTMLRKCAHVITNQVNNMPPTEEGEDPGKDLISIFKKFSIDIIVDKHMFIRSNFQ